MALVPGAGLHRYRVIASFGAIASFPDRHTAERYAETCGIPCQVQVIDAEPDRQRSQQPDD